MRALGLATALLLVASTSLAQIEQTPLAPPSGSSPENGVTERASRFQKAPFKTFRDQVGPFRPSPIEGPNTAEQTGTLVRQLDKMTGAIQTVEVFAGQEITLDRLTIRVETCRTRGEEAEGGAISFLKIWDARSEALDPVFSGWMFSESPALSALDHPRYDVWVMSCIATSGGAPSANE